MPLTETRPILPFAAIAATASILAGWLVSVDLLLGGVTVGAHFGAPVTGPPLFLVDAAGFAAYFALLLVGASLLYMIASRLARNVDAEGLWRVAFAAPLVGLGLVFVRLAVGEGNTGAGEEGGRLVTALLLGAVLAPVLLLGRLRRLALSKATRLAGLGVLLPVSLALAATAAGLLLPGDTRKDRLVQIAIALAWVAAGAVAAGLRARVPPLPDARRLLRVVVPLWGLPALVYAGHLVVQGRPGSGQGPSLVLVTFDAMRADRLSLYGGRVPAPNFEALAADSVVFEQSRSQAPHTVASMTSLFSSLFPDQLPHSGTVAHPARGHMIPASRATLAEALAKRGYATYAITANWSLGPQTGMLRGFSEAVVLNHIWRRRNLFSQVLPGLEAVVRSVIRKPEHEYLMDSSEVVLRYFRSFLDRHSSGPFFAWLHFMTPHDPFAPAARYRQLLRREGPWPVFAPHDETIGTPTTKQIREGTVLLYGDARQYVSDLYDCEVSHADDLLGQVRGMVRGRAHGRQVVWCVTADHGEEFWEHGGFYHGHTLYDELVHVPLLISAPGAARGLRVSEPVAQLDVMPTLSDLCGIPAPSAFRGRSLAAAVRTGARPSPESVFSDSNIYYEPREAVVARNYKLVRHRVTGRRELFDLRSDPHELHDIAGDRPDLANELAVRLDRWRAQCPPVGKPGSAGSDAEALRRLKALGYL